MRRLRRSWLAIRQIERAVRPALAVQFGPDNLNVIFGIRPRAMPAVLTRLWLNGGDAPADANGVIIHRRAPGFAEDR